MQLNIPVICGSVRNNRRSIGPAQYVAHTLTAMGHMSMLVDFLELPLPFVYSDPNPSKLNKQYPEANVQQWSSIVDAADGFIIVTPEYNHGIPGVLKNALDWLYPEFNNKPVGLVGVSDGMVGGARVVEALRPLCANFKLFDVQEAVLVRKVQDVFDAEGKLLDEKLGKQFEGLVNSVVWYAEHMRPWRV